MKKNIFERVRKRAKIMLILSIVAAVLGLALLVIGTSMRMYEKELRTEFQGLNENQYVSLTVTKIGPLFAEWDSYKYYWVEANGEYVVIEADKATDERLYQLSRQGRDAVFSERLDGVVLKMDGKLGTMAVQAYNELMGLQPPLSFADANIRYLVSSSRNADNTARYLPVWGGILLGFGLLFLLIAILRLRGVKRETERLQGLLPLNMDAAEMEERANIKVPRLKFFVYENLFVSEASGLMLMDLRDVSMAYVNTVRNRGGQSSSLVFKLKNKKAKTVRLPGKRADIDMHLEPFWSYLYSRFPYILQGISPETVAAEKERPKESLD